MKNVPKNHLIIYILCALFGLVAMFFVWTEWNELIDIIAASGFEGTGVRILLFIALVVIVLSLLGFVAVFIDNKKVASGIYALISVSVIFVNLPLGNIGKLAYALGIFGLFILSDFAIRKRKDLLVKPVYSLIFAPYYRMWLFGFVTLLAVTIALNPALALDDFHVNIPENAWEQLWDMFGTEIGVSNGEAHVQGVTSTKSIDLPQEQVLAEEDYTEIQSALVENGISIPNIEELFNSFGESVSIGDGLEAITGKVNEAISTEVKTQTENVLTGVLTPILQYWPIIAAVSFFFSSQLLIPIFIYIGVGGLKMLIFLLEKINLVQLTEEEGTISRHVLK